MEQAIAAARAAFPAWSALSYEERSAYIERYADALEANRRRVGPPTHTPSRASHSRRRRAGSAARSRRRGDLLGSRVGKRKLPTEVIEDTAEHTVEVHHTPLGVVGAILPWNFPVLLGLWKVAPC